MGMSDAERIELAERITRRRMSEYGTKRAAYSAANINAATWDRIEEGLPVRHDRLVAAVRTLWPHSGGDWRAIDEPQPLRFNTLGDLDDLPARVSRIEVTLGRILDLLEPSATSPSHLRLAADRGPLIDDQEDQS